MKKPLLIAHRGDTVHFRENTLEAFRSAIELGAGGIEFDIHLTENGELIVVHDFLYDKAAKYPTAEEVIKEFSQKGRLEIELKSFDPICIEKVASLVLKYSVKDYELTSSILPLLPLIKNCLPDSKIGMIFRSNILESWMTPDIIFMFLDGYMKLTKSDVLHLDLDRYTHDLAVRLHDRNYLLHTHLKTAEANVYAKVKELGLDQCTFDDINLLKLLV